MTHEHTNQYLADVELALLFIVEGLEQLTPAVKHEQQALPPAGLPLLQCQVSPGPVRGQIHDSDSSKMS